MTFTRPFPAAVSSGNLQRSGGRRGQKADPPLSLLNQPCSHPPTPLGFPTSSLGGWGGTLSAETRGHTHRVEDSLTGAHTHTCPQLKSHQITLAPAHTCHGVAAPGTATLSSSLTLPSPQPHLVSVFLCLCSLVSPPLQIPASFSICLRVSVTASLCPERRSVRGASCQGLG